MRPFKEPCKIEALDVAKRLQDYGESAAITRGVTCGIVS